MQTSEWIAPSVCFTFKGCFKGSFVRSIKVPLRVLENLPLFIMNPQRFGILILSTVVAFLGGFNQPCLLDPRKVTRKGKHNGDYRQTLAHPNTPKRP